MLDRRSCSSAMKSETVVPASMLPARGMTPPLTSMSSHKVLFPLPEWPAMTKFLHSVALVIRFPFQV